MSTDFDSDTSRLNQSANSSSAYANAEGPHTRIRKLNDHLRTTGSGGIVLMTDGIAALGASTVNEVFCAVAAFTDFSPDNDPHGEHDCALLTVGETRILWKIDYYDRSRRWASPDPTNPKVTVRVLTVMRADDF